MVILHVSYIRNDPCAGVCVAVPAHIRAQSNWAQVGFLNVQGDSIPGMESWQIPWTGSFRLDTLPNGFAKPDLVVFHDVYRPVFLGISRKLQKDGIPYIIIPHGCLRWEAQKKKWLKKKLGNLLLFNRFIRGATAIQCLSNLELENTHVGKKKFIGTNGVVMPDACKEDFRKIGAQLVFIGRLEVRVKGLDLLLEAVCLKAEYLRKQQCRIAIYGPDHDGGKAHLEKLIQDSALGDIVTVYDAVSGQEKESTLLQSDIFMLTSRHEGMPLGVLEAMSYGLPCILTKGTNLQTFINENNAGWSADNTAISIAEAIEQAMEEREIWQEKSRNAHLAVQREFDWSTIARETVAVYRDLLKE